MSLDLTDSRRKLARAWEHMHGIDAEVARLVDEDSPHTFRVGDIDEHTGWIDIFQTTKARSEPRLGVIFGDVLHNLRSALDYIVTQLALASGIPVSRRHQFPIRADEGQYHREVATAAGVANPDGPLGNITVGLDAIERFQPYKLQPYPRTHPLFILNWQANADKHRNLTPVGLAALRTDVTCRADDARVMEVRPVRPPPFRADREFLIARARVKTPIPATAVLHYETNVHTHPVFEGPTSGRGSGPVDYPPENDLLLYVALCRQSVVPARAEAGHAWPP